MSSDTPRTDAEWERYAREGDRDAGQHFAANLERELNDANAVALRYAYEIDRLKEEIEQNAWTSSPALAQAQIDQLVARNAELARDKARLDWLLVNPLEFAPVQIPCPDKKPGCLVYHCRPQTPSERRSTIDAAMEAMEAMEGKP